MGNASLLAMVAGSVVGPFPHREAVARLLAAAVEALVLVVWASGWWALEHHELPRVARQASIAFFWYAPAVTFALTAAEALALRRWSAYRS